MLETPMLTSRQQEIWQFLAEYVDGHGYPPTVREIGDAVGLASPSTVHAHLANLERAGLLRRDPTKPRAIELVGRPRGDSAGSQQEPNLLPLVGRIAAGGPMLAEEEIEDRIAVPEPLGRNADFLLRVKGESMIRPSGRAPTTCRTRPSTLCAATSCRTPSATSTASRRTHRVRRRHG